MPMLKIKLNALKWSSMRENLTLLHDNNNGANQPVQPRSLIRSFVIQYLETIVFKLLHVKYHNSSLFLFGPYVVRNPEDRVSRVVAKMTKVQHKDKCKSSSPD